MQDNENMPISHHFNSELKEGDVALIFRADGEPEIHHNIASLVTTGELVGGPAGNSSSIFLALSLLNVMSHDQPAMAAAMVRVAGLLDGGTLRLVM